MSMKERIEDLLRRRAQARKMGGEARLTRQKERGKLDARARLGLLLDTGSFHQIGLLATHLGKEDPERGSDAHGLVRGNGFDAGRPASASGTDITVPAGS